SGGAALHRLRHRDGLLLSVGHPAPRARLGRLRGHGQLRGHAPRRAGLRGEEGRARMGPRIMTETDLVPGLSTRRDEETGFFQKLVSKGLGWARKYSLFQYPFVTACCGMEYMSVAASRYDIARFGAEFPRFSPRQADLLMVVGTVNVKQGPILRRIYEQMA